ncbi:hypothetical protein M7784_11415 [Desulfovibrio aminophilus]|nr:hypothetical protein [Desulfovibrio aminophilus]MCM0755851.1 hypothetical protein [Desulfovibrio aminophilus]
MSARVLCLLLLLLALSLPAHAGPVEVFQPLEQNLSPMQLRAKARQGAFVQAVNQAVLALLPAAPGEAQQAKLREYFQDRAQQYVTGYQDVSAVQEPEGLRLTLNVEVNQSALRSMLRRCGAYYTAGHPLAYDLRLLSPLTAEESRRLDDLAVMGGLERHAGALPEFTLERGVGTLWKGTLRTPETQLSDTQPDPVGLWEKLWNRYFAGQTTAAAGNFTVLRVSGWFSPDGAAEFDRMLRAFGAVQDVQMLGMELATSGVAASWRFKVVDAEALEARLKEYLPSRGLTRTQSGG